MCDISTECIMRSYLSNHDYISTVLDKYPKGKSVNAFFFAHPGI